VSQTDPVSRSAAPKETADHARIKERMYALAALLLTQEQDFVQKWTHVMMTLQRRERLVADYRSSQNVHAKCTLMQNT
jgi:hypothetical protein